MLSAETAVGQYPFDSVNTMSNILEATEKHIKLHPHDSPRALKKERTIYHAVSNAAVNLAETVNAKAIVAFTASGKTAFRISRERPDLLLIVMTPDNKVRRNSEPLRLFYRDCFKGAFGESKRQISKCL